MNPLDSHLLLASLIWGGIGTGFVVYGKKQRATIPLFGGIALVATSYFAETALLMSLLCVGLLAAMYFLHQRAD